MNPASPAGEEGGRPALRDCAPPLRRPRVLRDPQNPPRTPSPGTQQQT